MQIGKDEILDWKNTINALLQYSGGNVTISFADGPEVMNKRYAIIHLHFWWILGKWNVPVTKDVVIGTTAITNQAITALFTKIYRKIIAVIPEGTAWSPLGISQWMYTMYRFHNNIRIKICADMWTTINELKIFIIRECGEYHCSISILDLCRLMKSQQIQDISDSCNFEIGTPSTVVEGKLRQGNKKLLELLKDKTLPHNVLYPFHHIGLINVMQVPQMMLAIGNRTDINDHIINYPIRSSFIKGLSNLIEYMAESLAAKLAAVSNKFGIPKSQYFARRQHLVSMAVLNIYPGDCGSVTYMPFYVYTAVAKSLIGKYHVVDNKLYQITEDNCDELIGTTIYMRSPITCLHTDGVCEICGGIMMRYLSKAVKIGMGSTIEVVHVITQLILSNKHLQHTNSVTYVPPKKLKNIISSKGNKLFWSKAFHDKVRGAKLGILLDDLTNISDLTLIKDVENVNIEHFSRITQIAIQTMDGETSLVDPIIMGDPKHLPYFSQEMLTYIHKHYKRLSIGDIVWIPLDEFDLTKPVFESLVVNYSMMAFVDNVTNFLGSGIGKYTSATEALRDLTAAIFRKVSTNIIHIEILLKSYMITNELDYSIPVVTDVDKVAFDGDKSVNIKRSLGTLLASERFFPTIRQPDTFVIPKKGHPMDAYLGFDEKTLTIRGPVKPEQ